MRLKTLITLTIFASIFTISCGSNATETDLKKAEESAKELESIDYDNITMPDVEEDSTSESEEEFDADAMLD